MSFNQGEVKERPILFNGEMVRANLDGRKSQTRRLIKPQPTWVSEDIPGIGGEYWDFGWCYYWPKTTYVHCWDENGIGCGDWVGKEYPNENVLEKALQVSQSKKKCPYGKPGDRLWVRETCQIYGHWVQEGITKTGKKKWKFIPHPSHKVIYAGYFEPSPKVRHLLGFYTRPSIHMPRWASRITLEITNVRVERLQDISEEDAWKEGFPDPDGQNRNYPDRARYWFKCLWNNLAGQDSPDWYGNPWVWVIEFKRIAP